MPGAGCARALPWIIAALVGGLGVVTVTHSLVAGVWRRQQELGVLKALGFDRHQVQRTIAVQASTFCLSAVVIGLPLGIVAGRLAWRQAMDALGIVVSPVTPVVLLLLAPTALVVFNAVAAFPARAAGRIQPTIALRAD